jgi:hypothetical protein
MYCTFGCEISLTEFKTGDRKEMGENMKEVDCILDKVNNTTI